MSKHRHRRRKKKLLPLLCIAVLCAALGFGLWGEQRRRAELEQRAAQTVTTKERVTIRWQGRTYALREDVEALLVIGVDGDLAQAGDSYDNPYQADFLTLVLLDRQAKTCQLLQLNRDTICDVPALAMDGRVLGANREQLALAHTYGTGEADSCRNVVSAVRTLLYNVPLQKYLRLRVDQVGRLNDAVGGVTVTLQEDFSAFDPTMTPGTTLTLQGTQAETFVRARQGMEEPTNLARMERQRRYLQGWLDAARARLQTADALELLEPVSDALYSNLSLQELADLADAVSDYTFPAVLTTPGEASPGPVFMEYHVDEEQLQRQVIELFYEPIKESDGHA